LKGQTGYIDTGNTLEHSCERVGKLSGDDWRKVFLVKHKRFCGRSHTLKRCIIMKEDLEEDKIYQVGLRVFTKSGYNDTKFIEISIEKSYSPVYTLIILTTIIGVSTYFLILHLYQLHVDVTMNRKQFLEYHGGKRSRENNWKNEYEKIQKLIVDDTQIQACNNKPLNRYGDIWPYDGNRVVLTNDNEGLQKDDKGFKTDYINASYIDVRL
jgi:hypothetical protein